MFKKTFVFKGCVRVNNRVVCDCRNNPVVTQAVTLAQAKSYIGYRIRRDRLHVVNNFPIVLDGVIEEAR